MTARFNLEPFVSPGYRRYFLASALAATGLWIYSPALEWIVLTRTGQAGAVGLLQTALIVTVALATLPSGLLTHRYGARRMLFVSLAGLGGMVAAMAVVAWLNALTFGVALGLTLVFGLFDGLFGVPAALLLAQVVPPRYLGSAIGLSYLTGGIGRLLGGPAGGAVLQVAGPTAAFVPAAVGLALAAVVILTIPRGNDTERQPRGGATGSIRPALRWLRTEPAVVAVTALGALSGASIFAYSALLPSVVRDLLGGDAATLGLLSGAGGVGSIAGSLAMEAIGRRVGRGRQVLWMFAASGLAVGALGLANVLPLALVLAAGITFLSICFGGSAQLLVQTIPPPHLRAGVVAIYTFAFYCVLPIGTATVGGLADAFGVVAVLLGMAALTGLGTAIVLIADRRLLDVDIDDHGEIVRRPERVAINGGQ